MKEWPNRYLARPALVRVLPRRRSGLFFPVVIGNPCQPFQHLRVSVFCAGMVRVRRSWLSVIFLIRTNTETAPNSYTGSGHGEFPHHDGGAHARRELRAPETSPCHLLGLAMRQARSLAGDAVPRRERSRGIETATELVIGVTQRIGSVSPALGRWAASVNSPRSKVFPARRPIQA